MLVLVYGQTPPSIKYPCRIQSVPKFARTFSNLLCKAEMDRQRKEDREKRKRGQREREREEKRRREKKREEERRGERERERERAMVAWGDHKHC